MQQFGNARGSYVTTGTFFLTASILLFAPLFRGGNRPIPLMFLELAALVLLALIVFRPGFRQQLSMTFQVAVGLLLLYPLLFLIPVPADLWRALPGRGFYAQLLSGIDGSLLAPMPMLSLAGIDTENSWLALLPPVMIFLAVSGMDAEQKKSLINVFLGIALFEALLGLIQYGDGAGSIFYLGMSQTDGSASGTYPNRNHFVGMLEMALPLALAMFSVMLGRTKMQFSSKRRKPWSQRLGNLFQGRGNYAVIYAAISIAILLGIIFTRSRTGIGLAMLGVLLSALLYSRRLGGRNVFGMVGTIAALGAALAIEIGLAPVFSRFTMNNPADDLRWPIFDATMKAIGTFFPLGSGPGTFPTVFMRFQTPNLPVFINHAHNDYLEWLMEGGLLVALLLALFAFLYIRQWFTVWTKREWSSLRFAQAGSGVALLLMALHGLLDFNLHIPANAIFFAFLSAVFFHHHDEKEIVAERTTQERQELHQEASDMAPPPKAREIPVENAINPFAE